MHSRITKITLSVLLLIGVQSGQLISAPQDKETTIGNRVTIQHGAVVCGSRVKDLAVLGMRSVVADGATVGEWAEVRDGAAVGKGCDVPDGAVAAGVPARVIGDEYNEAHKAELAALKEMYVDRARPCQV